MTRDDERLYHKLLEVLGRYAGETGKGEGALATLHRLETELAHYRIGAARGREWEPPAIVAWFAWPVRNAVMSARRFVRSFAYAWRGGL